MYLVPINVPAVQLCLGELGKVNDESVCKVLKEDVARMEQRVLGQS